jgi:hypothetical protein
VHTDARAAESAASVDALAYTIGEQIVFGNGQYSPGTAPGNRLLAHELTHVVQQSEAFSGDALGVSQQNDALEMEAEQAAHETGAQVPTVCQRTSSFVLARQLVPGLEQPPRPPPRPPPIGPRQVIVRGGQAEAARELARRSVARQAGRTLQRAGWRQFWRAVVRRFAIRGAAALALTAADGPLPIGDLIAVGLALWTIWEIIEIWDVLWQDAEGESAPESETAPDAQPMPDVATEEKRRRRSCRSDPCEHSLPISWPTQFPLPTVSPRLLVRTSAVDREWEGIDRGSAQRRMQEEIRLARNSLVPPPSPCFTDDDEPNAPYDAHHAHPLYLGGEDAEFNLCALRADRHQRGHPRLDNQAGHLPEYLECGVCSPFLSRHPVGQTYHIVGSK